MNPTSFLSLLAPHLVNGIVAYLQRPAPVAPGPSPDRVRPPPRVQGPLHRVGRPLLAAGVLLSLLPVLAWLGGRRRRAAVAKEHQAAGARARRS
jgi:hypothetical protein